ncbi:thioredoxin family protein [Anaeromicrobium sediminis]|uniref:Redox-active disulfide protein 2 n=1 Tax=Anaeromicrobium sediminis TaxID=1478221 RepID=A0A267MLM8_9FIRM|nr:thioredoxin family protein [Anaeromicrobium sediminis]PAB60446.1 redox-active disulfide protein 2 [Anaeromicrobium sediminis]
MNIKILGTGCTNCKKLEANAKKAVEELGLANITIEKVEDIRQIMKYGVMKTPALVINEKVKIVGKVAKTEEIKNLMKI